MANRSVRSKICSGLFALLCLVAGATAQTPASSAQAGAQKNPPGQPDQNCADQQKPPDGTDQQKPLQIIENPLPMLLVDKSGNASITVTLLNNSKDSVPFQLAVSNFCQKLPDDKGYYEVPVTATWATTPAAALTTGIPKDTKVGLKITISGLLDSGASSGQLLNSGMEVAVLHALRTPTAWNVQIDGGNEITFGPGLRTSIGVKNIDAMTYSFKWTLEAGGLFAPSATGKDKMPEQKVVYLPPSSSATIQLDPVQPEPGWLSAGFLKDQVENGFLVLTPNTPPNSPLPPAIRLPVKVHARYWSEPWQSVWTFVWTAILLLIGGLASLVFRYFIPNALGAISLRKKLYDMKQRLDGVGNSLDVRCRVVLDARIADCRARLSQVPMVFPEFATCLAEVRNDSVMLNQWLDIAYAVGTLLDTAQGLLQTGMPPTVLDLLERRCDEALEPIQSGFTKPEELQGMQSALAVATGYIKALTARASITDLEVVIKVREARVQPQVAALTGSFPGFAQLLTQAAANHGTAFVPDRYTERDILSRQADLLCDYRELAMNRGAGVFPPPAPAPAVPANALTRMMRLDTDFRSYVQPESHESLRIAQLLSAEMHQDFYPAALLTETNKTPPGLDILIAPSAIAPFTPVRFSLRFQRQELNEAAAPREWTVRWDFGDHTGPGTGWDVYHSFSNSGPYTVSVSLVDLKGNAIPLATPVIRAVTVGATSPDRKRRFYVPWTWTQEAKVEGMQLAFVLVIALAAVYAAARGKIETLDVPTAVLTVVGIGFGADTLKNLLTQKPGQQ